MKLIFSPGEVVAELGLDETWTRPPNNLAQNPFFSTGAEQLGQKVKPSGITVPHLEQCLVIQCDKDYSVSLTTLQPETIGAEVESGEIAFWGW